MKFRNYGLAMLAALGLSYASAQFNPIPEFDRNFIPKSSVGSADGQIYWKSAHVKRNNHEITELKGYVDVDIKIVFGLGEKIFVGFISRIDSADSTIESIIYSNGDDERNISHYDSVLAAKEGIDLTLTKCVEDELLDYRKMTVKDLEADTLSWLRPGSMDMQTLYFAYPKTFPLDTTVITHFKHKDYPLTSHNIFADNIHADTDRVMDIDMTYADPADSTDRKNLIESIYRLDIRLDSTDMPIRVTAKAKVLGFIPVTVEAIYEPPKKSDDTIENKQETNTVDTNHKN